MIRWAGVAGALVLAVTSYASQGEAERADLKDLQGKWEVVAHFLDGKPLTGQGKYSVWTISKDKVLYGPGREDTIRLDATKSPKQLDLDSLEDGKVRKGPPAIYALDRDTLILCVGVVGGTRPADFETKGRAGHRILVLRRVKG